MAASMTAHEVMALVARKNNATAVTEYRNHCTLDTCPLDQSYYYYRPSLAANAIFAALFGLALISFLLQVTLSRRFIGFTVAMVSGCILEVIGYAGRLQGWQNPFNQNSFLIQICCLTIAPSFLAAGLYLTLSRIVMTFGPENSRIKPLSYPRIFIPCDIVSLMLQAAGGGLASTASHKNESVVTGDNILVAGLAFQVLTLLVFICLSLDFVFRTMRRMRSLGDAALDPTHAKLRQSLKFKCFLGALSLATLCIFIRSVFRCVELGEGWTGHLIRDQVLFIALEGAMVALGVLSLVFFHPGLCFREGYDIRMKAKEVKAGKKSLFGRKKNVAAQDAEATHEEVVHEKPDGLTPESGSERGVVGMQREDKEIGV
ncbi:hypothetical protein MMC25_001640 [Agyrium rufum]|nr:hypothetical protein [Agyrium rufum]